MGNPFSWLMRSLVPVMIGVFGLVISGQERESEDFQLAVDLMSGDCRAQEAGLELADLYLFECQDANLASYILRTCRLGGEYRPIIERLRNKTSKDVALNCTTEMGAPREDVAGVLEGAEDQAVGALMQQNSLALIEEIYKDELDLDGREKEAAPAQPEDDGQVVVKATREVDQKKIYQYQQLVSELDPRVFIHIRSESDRASAELFRQALIEKHVNGRHFDVPPVEYIKYGPRETSLRVLKQEDVKEAGQIVDVLVSMGCPEDLSVRDISHRYEDDRRVRRRTYELWFTRDESAGCLQNYKALTGVRIPDRRSFE